MSLELSDTPGAQVTSGHCGDLVIVSNETRVATGISLRDFCEMVKYVMRNTDLKENDPRLKLIDFVSKLEQVEGYNGPKSRRLEVQVQRNR